MQKDKDSIGRPWLNEPDNLEFEAHGFPCHIKRHNHRPERNPKDWLGHFCAYVGIPKSHPYYGKSYDDMELEVHGGITYAKEDPEKEIHWIGFDCAHFGDLIPGIFEHRQSGGFLHDIASEYGDAGEVYRDINYVKAECEKLAEQLRKLA